MILHTKRTEQHLNPFNVYAYYQDYSIELVRRAQPALSLKQAIAQAKAEYEAGAMAWLAMGGAVI